MLTSNPSVHLAIHVRCTSCKDLIRGGKGTVIRLYERHDDPPGELDMKVWCPNCAAARGVQSNIGAVLRGEERHEDGGDTGRSDGGAISGGPDRVDEPLWPAEDRKSKKPKKKQRPSPEKPATADHLKVVRFVAAATRTFRVADVAASTGVDKSTVTRSLEVLRGIGFVNRGASVGTWRRRSR